MTDEEVKNLAHLARIEITDAEIQKFKSEIEPILAYVAQINSVQIDEVTPDHLLQNVAREDVGNSVDATTADMMTKNIPNTQDGFYKVPKIL